MELTKVTLILDCVQEPTNSRFSIMAVEQGTESPVYLLARVVTGGWFEWENRPPEWDGLELGHIQFPNAERKEKGLLVLERRAP